MRADRPSAPLLAAGFAALGTTAAFVPASLPMLGDRLGQSVVAAGVPALFGGLLAGVLIASLLGPGRTGRTVGGASLLQAAALLCLPFAPSAQSAIVAVVVAGIGFGAAENGLSVLTRVASAGRTGRALAGLTALVAASAFALPLVLAAGAAPVAVAAVCAVLHLAVAVRATPVVTARPAGRTAAPVERRALPVLAALALAVYVGAESVLSGWSAVIPAALLELDARAAALGTSAFWGLMTLGRAAAAALVPRLATARRYLVVSAVVAAVCAGCAAASSIPAAGRAALLAVAVLAIAPVYSLTIGEVLDAVPAARAPSVVGGLVAAGATGGVLLPLLVAGLVSPTAPSALVVVAAAFALTSLHGALGLRRSRAAPSGAQG